MCDYSLQNVKTRDAQVGNKLIITNFRMGTRGFAGTEDCTTAVCVKPGTELAFDAPVMTIHATQPLPYCTAVFAQVHKDQPHMHHDALEFPDGVSVLLTSLHYDQIATVLQLPAKPKTEQEAKEQTRVPVVA